MYFRLARLTPYFSAYFIRDCRYAMSCVILFFMKDAAPSFCTFLLLLSNLYCTLHGVQNKNKKCLHFQKKCAIIMRLSERTECAPLAQLDRASGYGPEGRGFESLRAYQSHGNSTNFRGFVFVFCTFPGGSILRYRSDPSRDPYGSSERLGLESTGEETSHRVRRLLLHGSRDVGVGIEG